MKKVYAICIEQCDFEAVESQALFSELETAVVVLEQIYHLYCKLVEDCFLEEIENREKGCAKLPPTFKIEVSETVSMRTVDDVACVFVSFKTPKAYWKGRNVKLFSELFDEYVSRDEVKQEIKKWLEEDCEKRGLQVSSFWSSFNYDLRVGDIEGISYSLNKEHTLEVY